MNSMRYDLVHRELGGVTGGGYDSHDDFVAEIDSTLPYRACKAHYLHMQVSARLSERPLNWPI